MARIAPKQVKYLEYNRPGDVVPPPLGFATTEVSGRSQGPQLSISMFERAESLSDLYGTCSKAAWMLVINTHKHLKIFVGEFPVLCFSLQHGLRWFRPQTLSFKPILSYELLYSKIVVPPIL